jgi:hypothetical protein
MCLLICETECWPSYGDWQIFAQGVLVTISWALYIYFYFRPRLEIGMPELSKVDEKSIIIPLTNKKKSRKATRIKVEVAIIDENDDSYHLSVIEDDFAFLAPNERRDFKAYRLNEYLTHSLQRQFGEVLSLLNEPKYFLRIRIHAT